MKRFAMALALTCVLSTSIFAGDMPTTGAVGQQPPPTTSSTMPGETHSPPGETNTPPETQEPGIGILATILLTIITWP
jgi:hypothetical protein